MSKLLIVNADDFGWDDASTQAIIDLLDLKKISSTTIMANWATPESLAKLSAIKGISTGLHLNLISGKPISKIEQVASLVDDSGNFFTAGKLFQKFLTKKIKSVEIQLEIKAQVKFLKDHGISISHADSHQHLHQFPVLSKVITKTLHENGITKIRNCNPVTTPSARAKIIGLFAELTGSNLAGFKSPQGLIPDFSFSGHHHLPWFEQVLYRSFRSKKILEIMTHPAVSDKPGSYLKRRQEYEFWKNTDLQALLLKHGVQLITYHQL